MFVSIQKQPVDQSDQSNFLGNLDWISGTSLSLTHYRVSQLLGHQATQKVLPVQQSSAASEGVFSS